MTALEYLKNLPYLPYDRENMRMEPSNSVLRRWLERGSVIINGVKPKPNDEVNYPITELVFFPKRDRVTML